MLVLTTPHRASPLPATPENIGSVLADLVGRSDPFVILGGNDQLVYMQTQWTPCGFQLEFQEGSVEKPYRATREDLTAAEAAAALRIAPC